MCSPAPAIKVTTSTKVKQAKHRSLKMMLHTNGAQQHAVSEVSQSPQQQLQHQQRAGAPRRCVHFEDHRNQYYENTLYCFEDASSTWYSPVERQRFHATHSKMIRSVLASDLAYAAELGDYNKFRQALLAPFELIQVACAVSTSPQQQQQQQQQQHRRRSRKEQHNIFSKAQRQELSTFYNDFPERLGLERSTTDRIRHEKAHRHHEQLVCILTAEQEMMNDNNSDNDHYRAAVYMQTACEQISLPSRVFAEEMGKALHASCMTDYNNDDDDDNKECEEMTMKRSSPSRSRSRILAPRFPTLRGGAARISNSLRLG